MRSPIRVLLIAALFFSLVLNLIAHAGAAPLPAAPTPTSSFTSGTLHVDVYGSGAQSIVLIPGLGCGTWEWYGTIAHFAPKYTIYALTLPGFDGQPSTGKKPLFATFSNDFWQLLDSHAISKPYVIGHSLGGTLAIKLGEEHPEKLAGIVAVDGMPVFPSAALMTPPKRAAQGAAMDAMSAKQTPDQQLAYDTSFMAKATLDESSAPALGALMAKSDPKAVGAWADEDVAGDLRPGLAKISVPLTEIMPYATSPQNPYTQDQMLGFYQQLLAGAPQVTVAPISPARHFAMLDQPEAFYAILAKAFSTQ